MIAELIARVSQLSFAFLATLGALALMSALLMLTVFLRWGSDVEQ